MDHGGPSPSYYEVGIFQTSGLLYHPRVGFSTALVVVTHILGFMEFFSIYSLGHLGSAVIFGSGSHFSSPFQGSALFWPQEGKVFCPLSWRYAKPFTQPSSYLNSASVRYGSVYVIKIKIFYQIFF